MHAIVIHTDIKDMAEAGRGLEELVIPQMKRRPGFVGAYYVAVDYLHAVAIEVFETEEQAIAALPEGAEAPGVAHSELQIGLVVGHA